MRALWIILVPVLVASVAFAQNANNGGNPHGPPILSNFKDSVLPTIGTATKVQGNPAVNITLNRPSSVASGHTMIAGYFAQTTNSPTPPSGWTQIRSDTCSGGTMVTFYKVAGVSEPSSYTWTLTNTFYSAALIDVGVTAANPVDAISPAACGATPTLAGLTTSGQPENVIILGAAVNSNINQVGFTQGTLVAVQLAQGVLPFSAALLTANYSTTPSVTLTGTGTNEAAQMIALKRASTYTGAPLLQGDGYAELTQLAPTFGANASIQGFNIDGRFNVKNPAYGAKGDGLTDDTAAIQAAQNAACAYAQAQASGNGSAGTGATVWFPTGTYITSFSLIQNCSQPVAWKCESESACTISEGADIFPLIMLEAPTYLSSITASGAILASSLATGSGSSLNWGTNSTQYYDLKDAQNASGASGWQNVQPINGQSALSVEGFLNYAGPASGSAYIMESNGDDLNLPNNASNAIQIVVQGGSPNTIRACITTSVTGFICTTAGGSITTGTTYEFEASYDGATLRIFEGTPGSTTTLAGSVGATGTIVQKPSEVFALGDGGTGLYMTGGQAQTTNHWIGQLDSIRISNTARHTSTYTAPTAKFANDGNTLLLMNNLAQSDTLLQVTGVSGVNSNGSQPVWIPLHSYALPSSPNVHPGFINLNLQGGNYNLLGINTLYTTLDHITGNGATRDSFKFWNNSYGSRIEHLTATPAAYGESGFVLSVNSGIVNVQWLDITNGFYQMELVDGAGIFDNLFMNPQSQTISVIDIGGTTPGAASYTFHEIFDDAESGFSSSNVPLKAWGTGHFDFYGANLVTGVNSNLIQVAPIGGASQPLALALVNSILSSNGGSPPALIGWKGTGSPETPAVLINPIINRNPLSAAGIALSDNAAYIQAFGDVTIPPQKTVSTLPTCNSGAKGEVVQISDCNANCTSYLGTTFTGGGTTRSTVQCNGTNWELH